MKTPFHQGELEIQQRANQLDIARRNGAIIQSDIPQGAIAYMEQQLMVVVSNLDRDGKVWASILFAQPGFIKVENTHQFILNTDRLITSKLDTFWSNYQNNSKVGLLFIEFNTRRRLRINGTIKQVNTDCYKICVEQAYSNCPSYIQPRHFSIHSENSPRQNKNFYSDHYLYNRHINMIRQASFFFVGSAHITNNNVSERNNSTGCDVSHRGGDPGFIKVIDENTLLIPDYQGNSMFNTLGNIQVYPEVGLVFIDFNKQRLLQISGEANINWSEISENYQTKKTQRSWTLKVREWYETPLPDSLHWERKDEPNSHSDDNQLQLIKKVDPGDYLRLKVAHIQPLNDRVKLFRLVPINNEALPPFTPGAHIAIEITLTNGKKSWRHYSLTSNHSDPFYEIAVQLEHQGRGGSMYIHQILNVNDLVTIKAPVNYFSLSKEARHSILVAGGIGITPIYAMARYLAEKNRSFELHYTVKSKDDLIFRDELLTLNYNNMYFYFTSQNARLNIQTLMKENSHTTHIYACGPTSIIESIKKNGHKYQWDSNAIHSENFSPLNLTEDSELEVILTNSKKTISVNSEESILDALLKHNIPVPYECKVGQCGLCKTKYMEGKVIHRDNYLSSEEQKEYLCLCVSRSKGQSLKLDL